MTLLRPRHISREYVRAHPDMLFVFGDNMARRGMGGQAAAMRGEPNIIGIPTKWTPRREVAYFVDRDWNNSDIFDAIFDAFAAIEDALAAGRTVVIPADGIGTGLADLPRRAPRIASYIAARIAGLDRP